jgi:hypothetical protein
MKGLALLLGPKMKSPPKDEDSGEIYDEEETDEEMLPSEEEVSDFRDLRHALKVGDEHLGTQAMKNFIATCIKNQLSK